MKKFILIFAILAAFVLSANAQTLRFVDKDYDVNNVYKQYTGVAGDTLNATFELAKNIFVGKEYFYHVNVQVEADSAADATNVAARLRGSWDNSNWINIGDAVTWAMSSEDTTFYLNSFASSSTVAGTETIATFNMTTDTTGYGALDYPFPDTVKVAVQTNTIATTTTGTVDGLIYPYLQVYFLGAGGTTDMELENLIVWIKPVKKE